jgi:hypothetical protein
MIERGNSNTEKSNPDIKTQFTADYSTIPPSDNGEHGRSNHITCIIGVCADCKEQKSIVKIVTFHGITKNVCEACRTKYSEKLTKTTDIESTRIAS